MMQKMALRRWMTRWCGAAAALYLVLSALPAQAQLLAVADWFERPVGQGVVWRYYRWDSLFGAKQSISYLEVDLSQPGVRLHFPYRATTRALTSTMINDISPQPAGGMNGTYFVTDAGGGGHRTYLRVNNTVIPPGGSLFSPWGYEGGLTHDNDGLNPTLKRIPVGGWVNNVTDPNIIACGPIVIEAGVIPTTTLNAIGSHCTSRHPRSAVGLTNDNRLIVCVVDGRTDQAAGVTCVELAQIMEALGCVEALNFDGGGSSTLWGRGEPFSGVLNYPSDNGVYDHNGQRSGANAIAISANAVSPLQWDGRVGTHTYSGTMDKETVQSVTVRFTNAGTETWTSGNVKMLLSRPTGRTSVFQSAGWLSAQEPVAMSPASVGPGGTASFTFNITAPDVATTQVFDEYFMLVRDGHGRFGPADNEARLKILVRPEPPGVGESFYVETRAGGQNIFWYSEAGAFADSGSHCTAPGATNLIGSRYGSTFTSIAGAKTASWEPLFPAAGKYRVYVAWPAGSNRRANITYHVDHLGGTDTFLIDQSAIANEWIQLGSGPYDFPAGAGGGVRMTNEATNVSGSMYAGPMRFEFIEDTSRVEDWCLY